MKRVKAACICQTLHFQLKEDVGHDYAVSLVQKDLSSIRQILPEIEPSLKSLQKKSKVCSL